jgi:hypothetical protein
MKRIPVFLDESLEREAKQFARKQGISFAAVVRAAVAAYVTAPSVSAGRLPYVAAAFASDHTDTSTRVDELIWSDPSIRAS